MYIADEYNSRIRKVTVSTGIITTIAGSGSTTATTVGDGGPATAGRLYNPTGVVLDSAGNIYIADWISNRVRKVTISTGIITTLAGNGGTGSYSGDNGAATAAELYYPYGVAVDSSGSSSCYFFLFILIPPVTRQRIYRRMVQSPDPQGSRWDYQLSQVLTHFLLLLFLDFNLPFSSSPQPSTAPPVTVEIISTIAGSGIQSYSGDGGQATAAALNGPYGVALDSSGEHFNFFNILTSSLNPPTP